MEKKGNQKRKYNAAYRLRKKIGEIKFPQKSKVIRTPVEEDLTNIPECKILLKEYGFAIYPFFE